MVAGKRLVRPPADPKPVYGWKVAYTNQAKYEYRNRPKVEYQTVREVVSYLVPEPWDGFFTAKDERVCPECGPLDGLTWRAASPAPARVPVHVNCRCAIGHHHTAYLVRQRTITRVVRKVRYVRVREFAGYELEAKRTWEQTGWE